MPDNIKTHARKLLQPYFEKPNASIIIDSAQLVAQLALNNKSLHKAHRTKMLSDVIWYCTEVHGKWKTRYKSKKVLELATNDPKSLVRINHEHVFTRKDLIREMCELSESQPINSPKLRDILETAVACIVTTSEHNALVEAPGKGWQRYEGIVEVYDTAESPPRLVNLQVNT